MPELPEVETIVRGLRPIVVGRRICGVTTYWERTIATPAPAEFAGLAKGQRIEGVERRGKFIVLRLERAELLIHLRMSGRLVVVDRGEGPDPGHLRVALDLDKGRLLFIDPRKFGRMYLVAERGEIVGELGPEPLEPGFTVADLAGRLQGRRVAIKSLLLNQRFLAGVGNIYADEALHNAGIAPQRAAGSLTGDEIAALYAAIREELLNGIRDRGTTLSDFRDPQGCEGGHAEQLHVYGREGEPCPRCGAHIVRERIGGRSSYHCDQCQK